MAWYLDLLGFSQQGDRPLVDGFDESGAQGPAIDIKLNMASNRQRRFYNFLRAIGFDFWFLNDNQDAYTVIDGRTRRGDHGPVTFWGPKPAPRQERPPPGPPAPPVAGGAPAGGAFPGAALDYAMDYGRRAREGIRDYVRDLFPEARPAFAYA